MQASFEFHVTSGLGEATDDAVPIGPEAVRLDMRKVQCFCGEEGDSLRRSAIFDQAERVRTWRGRHFGGDHHFDGGYVALARRIMGGIARRSPR